MGQQAGEPAPLVRVSAALDVLEQQPQIRPRIDEKQDRQPVPFVGGQRLDRRGHRDRADDGELFGRAAGLGLDPDRHAVRAPGFAGRHLCPSRNVRGHAGRVETRSANRAPRRIPIDSATWFAETISSVFGSTTISGTCMVLSRFCFSPSARAARSASRSALRRLTSKPVSSSASTAPSSATGAARK